MIAPAVDEYRVNEPTVGRVVAGRERVYAIEVHLEWLARRRAEQPCALIKIGIAPSSDMK